MPDTALDPEESLLADAAAHSLRECLEELDDKQRDAIRTAFYDGVTYAELAEARAPPPGPGERGLPPGRLRECLDRGA